MEYQKNEREPEDAQEIDLSSGALPPRAQELASRVTAGPVASRYTPTLATRENWNKSFEQSILTIHPELEANLSLENFPVTLKVGVGKAVSKKDSAHVDPVFAKRLSDRQGVVYIHKCISSQPTSENFRELVLAHELAHFKVSIGQQLAFGLMETFFDENLLEKKVNRIVYDGLERQYGSDTAKRHMEEMVREWLCLTNEISDPLKLKKGIENYIQSNMPWVRE